MNKWSLICSTFIGTINLLHFTPLFGFISSCSSHFSSMEQMLMLMLSHKTEWQLNTTLAQHNGTHSNIILLIESCNCGRRNWKSSINWTYTITRALTVEHNEAPWNLHAIWSLLSYYVTAYYVLGMTENCNHTEWIFYRTGCGIWLVGGKGANIITNNW